MNYKKILFLCILVVTVITRLYKFGSFPSGLTWDEAAIGYNAYGLITNHRDEWLKRTPIAFQSFGDFKSPLLIYADTIPVALFGLTPFAVRLPIALAGIGLVIVSYLLAKELFKEERVALAVMALVSLSPWAIHYSRMAFESMLACFLVTTGVYFFVRWTKKNPLLSFAFCLLPFALSLYAYHSAKVVVPIIGFIFFVLFRKLLWLQKKHIAIGGIFGLLLLSPLVYASLFGKANARAMSTTIFAESSPLRHFVSNYVMHLSPAFLVGGHDITYRHSTMQVGVLYPIELLLFVIGIFVIATQRDYRKFWWIPVLFLVGLIPAALGLDVPHSNRALLALPWAQMTGGIAIFNIQQSIFNKKKLVIGYWLLVIFLVSIEAFSFARYLGIYTRVYSKAGALRELGYGYDEVMNTIRPLEGSVDHVYFTNSYGQAYIFILFAKKLTPMEYQHGGLANYTIANDPMKEAGEKKNLLIVGTRDEIPDTAHIVKEILYPDGNVAWRIAEQ